MQMVESQTKYSVARRTFPGQCGSHLVTAVCALGITFLLFAVVPLVLHPGISSDLTSAPVRPVTVVRAPRREKPIRPSAQPTTITATKQVKTVPSPQRPQPQLKTQLELPFELAAQLPDLPAVSIPQVEQVSLAAADFAVPEIFASGELDQPLVALVRQQPLYPLFAKQRRVQGQVRVRFVVTRTGTVEQITIIQTNPSGVFEESVVRCVSGWRFRPGTVEGVAVDSWAETTISFVLK